MLNYILRIASESLIVVAEKQVLSWSNIKYICCCNVKIATSNHFWLIWNV